VKRPVVLLLGPSREAMSGVTTHVNALLASRLASHFELAHFQVGSEGRAESALGKLARLALSPFVLGAAILRANAALVHINTSLGVKAYLRDLVYVLVARLCGASVVCQIHGGALPREFARTPVTRALLRATLRLPDTLVVLASADLAAYREFVPEQDVVQLANGIDCTPYQRYNRAAPAAAEPLRLIYIGRLVPAKGLPETIEALRIVRARGIAARLVIAGGGPDEARLQLQVREAGLSRDVTFVGDAYGDRKVRLLANADALMLASYAEGLPFALLEAMAAGVVPVATPVGAIPDVMTSGEHGLLVEPRDAHAIADGLLKLASDRKQLARMSAACRRRVALAYSLDRVVHGFTNLYCNLCTPRAPKAVL
jgi:glycosyltransferase involved in cell wall biosynthesis